LKYCNSKEVRSKECKNDLKTIIVARLVHFGKDKYFDRIFVKVLVKYILLD
jgi:hypothetical protein